MQEMNQYNQNLQTPMVNPQYQQQQQFQQQYPQQYPQQQFQQQPVMFMQPPIQQVVVMQQQQAKEPLKTYYKELFSCLENCDTCLIGYLCGPIGLKIMHAMAVNKATEGRSGCIFPFFLECCCCCCINRQTIRHEYQIVGSMFEDCLLFYFCPFCTYLQDINEVNYRIANNLTGK